MTKYARLLLGCYRTGEANDPEVYVAAITAVLAGYPEEIVQRAVDPLNGVPSKIEWLPKPFEVKRELDAIYGPILRHREREERTVQQLAERARLESLPPPTQSYGEFREEMAARGLPIDKRRDVQIETVDAVKAKYGITDQQWDALPDLPEKVLDRSRERVDERRARGG